MSGFRARRYEVLVATDVAARGIDVRNVSHVINFDVPNTPEAYTHRIGRTGRSETAGVARTFVTRNDGSWVRDTERMIGSTIPRHQVEGFAAGLADTPESPQRSSDRVRPTPSQGRPRSGRRPGGRGQSRRRSYR